MMKQVYCDDSVTKLNDSSMHAILEMEKSIGTSDVVELLDSFLPTIVDRKDKLNAALEAADFEEAAKHAHKVLGSIKLYGSEMLEDLLMQLKLRQVTDANVLNFRQQLSGEFDSVSVTIREWLSQTSPR